MSRGFQFRADDRLLIAAPHPDDETLATGGLIQRALASGIPLRIVMATDGDNNPWPQRWLEKRWRIDATARRHWGSRRRKEAEAALGVLGVPASAVRFLGWPDQGLTELLMRDSMAESTWREEIEAFAPTVLAGPSRSDLHPDHNALHVMLACALQRAGRSDCRWLGYIVHGTLDDDEAVCVHLEEGQRETKRRALLAHASQLVLSRGRMQRLCDRDEQFEREPETGTRDDTKSRFEWHMPWQRTSRWLSRHEVLLVLGRADGIVRLRLPLSRLAGTSVHDIDICAERLCRIELESDRDTLRLSLSGVGSLQLAFAKIERPGNRLLIYDAHGWTNVLGDEPAVAIGDRQADVFD